MTTYDFINICKLYEQSWEPKRSGAWYSHGSGDYQYTMHFLINWARAKLEEMNRLNRQLKSLIG